MTEHGRRDYELGVLTDRAFRTLLATKVQLRRRQPAPLPLAVLSVHLNWDGEVDPAAGEHFGNEVVQASTERIVDCLRVGDDIARSGPANFRIVLDPLGSVEVAHLIARTIHAVLGRPFFIGSAQVTISASVGISLFPDDGVEAEPLMIHADRAMQQAKGSQSFTSRDG